MVEGLEGAQTAIRMHAEQEQAEAEYTKAGQSYIPSAVFLINPRKSQSSRCQIVRLLNRGLVRYCHTAAEALKAGEFAMALEHVDTALPMCHEDIVRQSLIDVGDEAKVGPARRWPPSSLLP